MACTSGSVQTVADKTVAAENQIVKLQSMIEAQETQNKAKFIAKINESLANANVNDARLLTYNSAIKTEYTSEFSLDKIVGVVTAALNAVAAATDPKVISPAMSPTAIAAYSEVVNSVAEAAKSYSTAAASLSYSMTRLSPGMFAFLSASTVSINDVDTFGTEAVTTTAIYYQLMQSIDDIRNETKFGEAIINSKNIINMRTLQAALTDDLASGKITIEVWMIKDAAYDKAIAQIQARLDTDNFKDKSIVSLEAENESDQSITNRKLVSLSIERLSAMGDAYKEAVQISKNRLSENYF